MGLNVSQLHKILSDEISQGHGGARVVFGATGATVYSAEHEPRGATIMRNGSPMPDILRLVAEIE